MKLFIILFIYIRLFFINKRLEDLDRKNKIIENILKNISDKKISPKVVNKMVAMALAIYNNKMQCIGEESTLKMTLIKLGAD